MPITVEFVDQSWVKAEPCSLPLQTCLQEIHQPVGVPRSDVHLPLTAFRVPGPDPRGSCCWPFCPKNTLFPTISAQAGSSLLVLVRLGS